MPVDLRNDFEATLVRDMGQRAVFCLASALRRSTACISFAPAPQRISLSEICMPISDNRMSVLFPEECDQNCDRNA